MFVLALLLANVVALVVATVAAPVHVLCGRSQGTSVQRAADDHQQSTRMSTGATPAGSCLNHSSSSSRVHTDVLGHHASDIPTTVTAATAAASAAAGNSRVD